MTWKTNSRYNYVHVVFLPLVFLYMLNPLTWQLTSRVTCFILTVVLSNPCYIKQSLSGMRQLGLRLICVGGWVMGRVCLKIKKTLYISSLSTRSKFAIARSLVYFPNSFCETLNKKKLSPINCKQFPSLTVNNFLLVWQTILVNFNEGIWKYMLNINWRAYLPRMNALVKKENCAKERNSLFPHRHSFYLHLAKDVQLQIFLAIK